MEKATFSAEINELHRILDWMRGHFTQRKAEAGVVRRIELALEEAVVNVIHHGYAGGKGKIEIGLKWEPGRVEILVRDWGPPFNPLANAPHVDPEAPSEARKAGGLGIYLMGQIMDELTYAREDGANVLTMVKSGSF